MKKNNRENSFLIGWLMCILLLIGVCNLGFIRGTWAAFGNVTGQLGGTKTIKYISNYPNELEIEEEVKSFKQSLNKYTVLDSLFVLDGYEFVNWNTISDGSGDSYAIGTDITLKGDITFYAQWKKIEIKVISYGDSNLDGVISADDYSLIEKYINDGVSLDNQGVINADVNQDGKIDLVDVDIIKQVCLGTEGYVGKLPLEPILVYEIYEGNNTDDDGSSDNDGDDNSSNDGDGEIDTDDKNDENINNDNDNNKNEDDSSNNDSSNNDSSDNDSSNNGSSGSGGGTGSSGSGSGSSGSSGGGKKPSGGSNKPSKEDNKEEEKEDNKIEEDTENKDNNNVDGSEDKEDNTSNNIINKVEDKKRVSYVGIIVFVICILSFRLIIYVIDKFRKKELNKDNEESKK